MATLKVEKVGGLAGFGGAGARLRSRGQIDVSSLSESEQHLVDSLFARSKPTSAGLMRDGFKFRLTRLTDGREQTIEVAEHEVPRAVAGCVKDEFV